MESREERILRVIEVLKSAGIVVTYNERYGWNELSISVERN